MGTWFYNKVDSWYNWAADRYNVKTNGRRKANGEVSCVEKKTRQH